MEHLTVALSELYNRKSRPHLPRMIQSRCNARSLVDASSAASSDQGLDERILFAYKSVERTVTLPIVKPTDHCTNFDINSNIDGSSFRISQLARTAAEERQREPSDVVIVQLYDEKDVKRDAIIFKGANQDGKHSPLVRSPRQHKRAVLRRDLPDGCDKSPSLRRASAPVVEQSKFRSRSESIVVNGFTQMDLKKHNERHRQRLNSYVPTEEQRSRSIVEEWLKSLP